MLVAVIDGQGGGIGRQIIDRLSKRPERANMQIAAIGTNSTATSAMSRAGADMAATGENAVIVMSAKAELILGPIGILLADSMMGELTANMAAAVARSAAKKIVIPIGKCGVTVAGASTAVLSDAVEQLAELATAYVAQNSPAK